MRLSGLFVVIALSLVWIIQGEVVDTLNRTVAHTRGSLIVNGFAKKSLFTNLSEISFSINCDISLESIRNETGVNISRSDVADGLVNPSLRSQADLCASKIHQLLNKTTIHTIQLSDFVFTPLYKMPIRRYRIPRRYPPRRGSFPLSPHTDSSVPDSPVRAATYVEPMVPIRHPRAKHKLMGYIGRKFIEINVPTSEAGLLIDQLVQNKATIFKVRAVADKSYIDEVRKSTLKEAINDALFTSEQALANLGLSKTSVEFLALSVSYPEFSSYPFYYEMGLVPRLHISKRNIVARVSLRVHH